MCLTKLISRLYVTLLLFKLSAVLVVCLRGRSTKCTTSCFRGVSNRHKHKVYVNLRQQCAVTRRPSSCDTLVIGTISCLFMFSNLHEQLVWRWPKVYWLSYSLRGAWISVRKSLAICQSHSDISGISDKTTGDSRWGSLWPGLKGFTS